jgi:cytochrome P450
MLSIKNGKRVGFGPNLVVSEHEEWRKHRRIAGPSFSESNNRLVWESSIDIILGYFNKWNRDGKGGIVKVDNFTEVTAQITYMVFTTAGMSLKCVPHTSADRINVVRFWDGRGLGPRSEGPWSGPYDAIHGSTESRC